MSCLPCFFCRLKVTQISCGNVGKLTRIADTTVTPAFKALHPRKNSQAQFVILGGFADFLLPSTYVNGHGAITGLANLAPVSCLVISSLPFNMVNSLSSAFNCAPVQAC